MLSPNFMGLYQPQMGAASPPAGNVPLNPVFGANPGLYGSTQGASPILQHQGASQAPATDWWKLLQPKLDAYMSDWQAKQQAAQAARMSQSGGSEAGMNGSGITAENQSQAQNEVEQGLNNL